MKQRNTTLDIMRGIAILLIVLFHCFVRETIDNPFNNIILITTTSFSMVVFTVISGYVSFGKIQEDKYLSKKITKFILIIFFSAIIYWVWWLLFPNLSLLQIKEGSFVQYYIFNMQNGFVNLVTWYLFMIVQCYILAWIIEKIASKSKRLNSTLLISIFIIIIEVLPYHNTGFDLLKWYSIFYFAGYLLARYGKEFFKYNKILYISLLLFPLYVYLTKETLLYQPNENYVAFSASIGMTLGKLAMAILGTMFVYSISRIISKVKHLNNILCFIGVYSLGIYLIHPLFAGVSNNYWVSFLITTLLSIAIYWLFDKCYKKILIWKCERKDGK